MTRTDLNEIAKELEVRPWVAKSMPSDTIGALCSRLLALDAALEEIVKQPDHDEYCDSCAHRLSIARRALNGEKP